MPEPDRPAESPRSPPPAAEFTAVGDGLETIPPPVAGPVGRTGSPPDPDDVVATIPPPPGADAFGPGQPLSGLTGLGTLGGHTVSDLDRVSIVSRMRGEPAQRYRVDEEIGRGGMGRVLRVQDADLNRPVAMKTLIGHGQEHVLRFVEEAQISSQLQHPSVLPVHDFGVDKNGDFFFTMQLVEGSESLRAVIEKLKAGDAEAHARYSFEARVQIIQRVCQALHYAHERGVIHRDIKPDNIVVGTNGEVWLVDWGIATVANTPVDQPTLSQISLGTTADGRRSAAAPTPGALVGTPRYMAPEQILGIADDVDAVTDVYALSAVLYEFLTLRHYLGDQGDSLGTLMSSVTTFKPRNAEEFVDPGSGRVPRHLSRYCRKGLSKAKEERYQTAAALERDLQDWLEGNAPIVCPGTAMQRGLRRFSHLIDKAPFLVPALTITLGILFLGWVVFATLVVLGVVA